MREPSAVEAGVTAARLEMTPVIRDACPSVHEPFSQVDGALVRIRVPGGLLSTHHARSIAAAAGAYGTGLEITSRANLQIRGVTTRAHPLLVADLVAAGVTLADAAADARRNVLASPTAGLDPSEVTDTRPLTAAITMTLVLAEQARLSPKFGVLIDAGGAVTLRGRRQDICLGAVRLAAGNWAYEVRLGLALSDLEDAGSVVLVSPDHADDLVRGLLDLMVQYPESGGRMSGLVDQLGMDEALRLAAAPRTVHLSTVRNGDVERVPPTTPPIGQLPQRQPGRFMVGAMPVLGRLSGRQLETIAEVAEDFGAVAGEAELRLTPWRSVIIPDMAHQGASPALEQLEQLGLAVHPDDPALSVVACAGSTGCPSSFTDTQRDALALVEILRTRPTRASFSVHFSGCSKRCADSTTTFDVTLVGGPTTGAYEVVTEGSFDPGDVVASVRSAGGPGAT